MSQPLNCQSFCNIEKEYNIARGATKDGSDMQHKNCLSQCNHNQSNSNTVWPCLLASSDLTPTNFNDRINQCSKSLHINITKN